MVSQLDHDANVRPWVQWAEASGVEVRWATIDVETGELPTEQYGDLVDERTRLVAVTGASNVLGTRPDVRAITDLAHAVGALAYVDGVHTTAHGVVDIAELGSDFYAHQRLQVGRAARRLRGGRPRAARAHHPVQAGVVGEQRPLTGSSGAHRRSPTSPGSPRRSTTSPRLDPSASARAGAGGHLARRRTRARDQAAGPDAGALETDDRVTLYGRPKNRTATVYFRVAGRDSRADGARLADAGINAWQRPQLRREVTRALGIRDTGSAVRVSLAHYSRRSATWTASSPPSDGRGTPSRSRGREPHRISTTGDRRTRVRPPEQCGPRATRSVRAVRLWRQIPPCGERLSPVVPKRLRRSRILRSRRPEGTWGWGWTLHRLWRPRYATASGSVGSTRSSIPGSVRRVVDEVLADYGERSLGSQAEPITDGDRVARDVVDAVAGLGPLQQYLDDPEVEEIWINDPGRVFIARDGRSELTTTTPDRASRCATSSSACSSRRTDGSTSARRSSTPRCPTAVGCTS